MSRIPGPPINGANLQPQNESPGDSTAVTAVAGPSTPALTVRKPSDTPDDPERIQSTSPIPTISSPGEESQSLATRDGQGSTSNLNHPNHHQDGGLNAPSLVQGDLRPTPASTTRLHSLDHPGAALTDTPLPSAPGSPRIPVIRQNSGSSTPRVRPTTLDIPGLTKSKVSPDGRIAQRDVGSKLVIVMVGLPARGKSYITKKLARYLNWLQHDTRIFNVGERRRLAAHGSHSRKQSTIDHGTPLNLDTANGSSIVKPELSPSEDVVKSAAEQLSNMNGVKQASPLALQSMIPRLSLPSSSIDEQPDKETNAEDPEALVSQSAGFFDPRNKKASQIREQAAMDTLDELLEYILNQGGSVGIFDATNSTLVRRKLVMEKIRERAGLQLNVLYVESICEDQALLESNMRLKLSGPDYRDKDPMTALEDFRQRVAIYERNYVPLGHYEEVNNMPYVKMVDVGRKVITHQVNGFLSTQAVYYLLNFNLSPRCIWITRHGESQDNVAGKIGGNSSLSPKGAKYARALAHFIEKERSLWEVKQRDKALNTHFPPHPGDHTPPNPYYAPDDMAGANGVPAENNFCVWTSMLKRSIETGVVFDDDEKWDVKQFRMLDELNAGIMEGMTYEEIRRLYPEEYDVRQADKLAYRYPGPGGEGYLDVINRLRPVIVELERMEDHCLLITHRSVARVLLAYFLGLRRDSVADLECPLGMVYCLEPKPYGVEFHAYRYKESDESFEFLPDYEMKKSGAIH
ncbi:bifunctional 6-phosphofructo-2-kinase/fructose-2,6-bisphosphate 2-phosphatase [Eremomyces bilateralis CBS 781.70]|uniref:Bifunctional 6-phosphofructo-2-kinase/fructose-2,6-bisphosphate 2-phosphatase n=1 Tax=Eremomyces bilateralis CBS 781.70 TaxID=1392243 RepID=A0A6G1FX22_9PEZI|nr:bifunctional 6-phosphofructo-2-kinase/fructose-2,6-bisphosphate 2-phosphatase [Eremomyces bilateralis CBS 781.70]KAF1810241.1 bifunctional 6-phosphofructo-2-kinase/fructose-2,6-bisphosphate 2-phosphatase [Eremomyces bilateralis CBS 781.70]